MVAELEYRAKGAAASLFRCHSPEVLIEGPAGTGKTRAILEWINYLSETYPGVRVLIARATRVSLTQSVLVTWETKVLWQGHPAITGTATRANRHAYLYPNGSEVVAGGLDNPEGLYSTEWDIIYVPEATEINEDAWEKFARAMRNRKIPRGVSGGPIKPGEKQAIERDEESGIEGPAFFTQRIADCNPHAPGHWLNKRPDKPASRMVRLKSRHQDNPSITAGELAELRALTGHRRSRLYAGLWVAAEGGVYTEFHEAIHKIAPFPSGVPEDWPIISGVDPGLDHPCAWLWFTVAPNNRLYIVDEIVGRGIQLPELAKRVLAKEAEKGWTRQIRHRYGDPQYIFKDVQEAKSFAQQMAGYGIKLEGWPRTGGTMDAQVWEVQKRWIDKTLYVTCECPLTIESIQGWQYRRTATGDPPASDGDKYEQLYKDVNDVIRGVVAANPVFAPSRVRVTGGE